MYNKKVLREATKNLDRTKAPAKNKDMIIDPMGQWKYPGQNTRIPSNDITMQGVPYPVWAVPNVGTPQMMYPEQNYTFPGAEYVDEYPQVAQRGGDISIPDLNQYEDGGEYDLTDDEIAELKAGGYIVEDVDTDEYKKGGTPRSLPKKKSSKAYSRSLTATNKLFAQSPLTKKSKSRKNKIFDPNAKYYQYGGVSPLEGNYLSKVIMNRNRGTDFVDRAYALGANPGTPIFNVPDDEQFGAYMSHKMAYGEDDSGKTWMFPTVLNPNNEAIEVPGQYADYISSEGYKYATGMKQKGGFQDDLGKHRKLIRDWTYGQSIGMLQRAQEGLDTGVVESRTPWKGAANVTGEETTPPVIFEGKDVTVKAEAPKWAGYQKEYQNANPWDRYLAGEKNKYIRKNKGLNKAAGVSASNFPKDAEERIRQEYDRKMNTYTTRRLGKHFDYNPRQRGEWIDLLTPKEKEIVAGSKYGSKLQPDAWSRFMSGARSIYNAGPLSNITGDITTPIRGYTERENKEALNNWAEGMEALAPLDVPGMVVANKMKNMNAENPSWYSGEMMGNVDYGDVVAMNPLTLLDIYGLPQAGVSLARGITKGSKAAGKYLTTQTPLKNAYKLNPRAGRLGEYNRVVGQDAVDDIVESGLVRVNENAGVAQDLGPFGTVNRTTPYPSFGKAKPQQTYANQVISQGKTPYIISTDRPMKASTLGRHGRGATQFPVDDAGKYMTGFPASEAKVFEFGDPHWLKGYEPISTKGSTGNLRKFTNDFEDAPFLAPEKSYFQPQTDLEKEIANQADEYFRLKTSGENLKRAQALDQEYGTNYTKALYDFMNQKQNQNVASKYPFNINVVQNPGEGTGAYSQLTAEGAQKYKSGLPVGINDREIGIYSDTSVGDVRRKAQHELSHHVSLSQDGYKNYENEWGNLLRNSLETPGEISKTNPKLAAKLIEPAFPKMKDSPSLYDYISDESEIEAYINTNFRDELVKKGILKNHLDTLDDNKMASYFMEYESKDKIVNTLLDVIKPKDFIKIFNKGIYAIPAAVGAGAATQQLGQHPGGTFQDGGYTDVELTPEEIDWYLANDYDLEELPDDYEMPMAQGGFEIQGLRTQPVKSSQPKPKAQVKEDVVVSKQSAPSKITIEGLRTAPVVEKRSSDVTPYVQSIFDKRAAQPYVAPKKEKVVAAPKDVFSKSKYAYQPLSGYLQNNPIVSEPAPTVNKAKPVIKNNNIVPTYTITDTKYNPTLTVNTEESEESKVQEVNPKVKKYQGIVNNIDNDIQKVYYNLTNPVLKPEEKAAARKKYQELTQKRGSYIKAINSVKRDEAGWFDVAVNESPLIGKPLQKLGFSDQASYMNYDLPKFETYNEKKEKEDETFKQTSRFENLNPNKSEFTRWKFRATASNDDPLKVAVYGTRGERANQNVEIKSPGAIMHFLDQSPETGYMHENTKNYYSKLKENDYVGYLKPNDDGTSSVQYKPRKEFNKNNLYKNTFFVRQVKFDDIDFKNKVKDDNFAGHTYPTIKGTEQVALPISSDPDENIYDYSSGQSVVYIFNYKEKIRYQHFAGSRSEIKKEGEELKKMYNLNNGELTIGLADAGSYSSAVSGNITNNKLNNKDYGYYNGNPNTGAGIALLPK